MGKIDLDTFLVFITFICSWVGFFILCIKKYYTFLDGYKNAENIATILLSVAAFVSLIRLFLLIKKEYFNG